METEESVEDTDNTTTVNITVAEHSEDDITAKEEIKEENEDTKDPLLVTIQPGNPHSQGIFVNSYQKFNFIMKWDLCMYINPIFTIV